MRRDLANEAHKNISDISAIYFDGRKDLTQVLIEREDGNLHHYTAKEEHYTVISETRNFQKKFYLTVDCQTEPLWFEHLSMT